jgi:hypothetical protein
MYFGNGAIFSDSTATDAEKDMGCTSLKGLGASTIENLNS